jgi:hypothetical protein
MDHAYQVKLGEIGVGKPFRMVNYEGVWMRVSANHITMLSGFNREERQFNDDGFHVPIVDLGTGNLIHMSKVKPCLIFAGESFR